MNTITEGKAKIHAPKYEKISKDMGVFYNPAMKLNRDLTILLLNSAGKKDMQIADPLAGTGVRSIRMLLELEKDKIGSLYINDYSKTAVAEIKRNLKLNRIKSNKIIITAKDANIFMLESKGFDYIDIDPFGYPGKFLDAACQRIARGGIIAVTATDTAALAGTSPGACERKYWAKPLRNEFMHETGARILIRRVQLSGMQYEKALIPLFTYNDQHYTRSFFICEKGRNKASTISKNLGYISYCEKCLNREIAQFPIHDCNTCGEKNSHAGPLWAGAINDSQLLSKMLLKTKNPMLQTMKKESGIQAQWFFDLNNISGRYKIKNPPNIKDAMRKIRKIGHKAERTQFGGQAVRTTANIRQIVDALKR